jgi:hypothetical protein
VGKNSWAFRFVIGYRASLTRGRPRKDLRGAWGQLAAACPDWPGFWPERRSLDMLPVLEEKDARFVSGFEALCNDENA